MLINNLKMIILDENNNTTCYDLIMNHEKFFLTFFI